MDSWLYLFCSPIFNFYYFILIQVEKATSPCNGMFMNSEHIIGNIRTVDKIGSCFFLRSYLLLMNVGSYSINIALSKHHCFFGKNLKKRDK